MTIYSIICVIICICSIGFIIIDNYKYLHLTENQINKLKEWLLYAVTEAEKEYGNKTGKIKLRYVYSLFINHFPSNYVKCISFEDFSNLVDEVLITFNKLLLSNSEIQNYVKGDN